MKISASGYPEGSLAERYASLDSQRNTQLSRARECASLTIPAVMPPEGFGGDDQLSMPYSSMPGRGVSSMASKLLSSLIPLNDNPFFAFSLKSGVEPDAETFALLEAMAYQVMDKLSSKNLRDTVFHSLESLLITGDSLVLINDDYSFRSVRPDGYVVVRDNNGDVAEMIYVEFELLDPNSIESGSLSAGSFDAYGDTGSSPDNYRLIYCRYVAQEDGTWDAYKEDADGKRVDAGTYETAPFAVLRWNGVTGEHYGRSHVEENFGDIQSLQALTQTMLEGFAAGSTFWMTMNPTGPSELDDVVGQPNGSWISVRNEDVSVLTPAQAIGGQLQATQQAVDTFRREVAKAFLMDTGTTRQADRVTATEIRMQTQEMENVLGGAFSAIARELFAPIVQRVTYLMIADGALDARLQQEFSKDGSISLDIVTGLQAMSRDGEMQKLMQLGEMVRNLPPEAIATFRWDAYSTALIASLGFDSRNWIKSEEDVKAEKAAEMQQVQAMQMQQSVGQAAMQGMAAPIGQAAAAGAEQQIGQAAQQMLGGM